MIEIHLNAETTTEEKGSTKEKESAEKTAKDFADQKLPPELLLFMIHTLGLVMAFGKFKKALPGSEEALRSGVCFPEINAAGKDLIEATQNVLDAAADAEKAMKKIDEKDQAHA